MSTGNRPETVDSCMQFAECLGLNVACVNGDSFVFSPLPIRAALSLAAAGSNGQTLEEFLSFLDPSKIQLVNSTTENLLAPFRKTDFDHIEGEDGGSDISRPRNVEDDGDPRSYLSLHNGIWIEKTLTLKLEFQGIAASIYRAEAKSADFKNKASAAAREVNAWVETKTKGLVKKLIPWDALNSTTSVALASALYFKGLWMSIFDVARTKNELFHLLTGSIIRVPFMSTSSIFSRQLIATFNGFKVLKLHYKPNGARAKFSMLILLPDKKDGLPDLLQKAISDPSFFHHHVPSEWVDVGRFSIPRFKISCEFEPSKVLPELGLRLPFNRFSADFTEMACPSHPDFKPVISCIRYRATIKIDELGAEVNAVTDVEFDDMDCFLDERSPPPPCPPPPPPPPPSPPRPKVDFVADHPFMFVVTEDQTGSVLFFDHVFDPAVEQTTIL